MKLLVNGELRHLDYGGIGIGGQWTINLDCLLEEWEEELSYSLSSFGAISHLFLSPQTSTPAMLSADVFTCFTEKTVVIRRGFHVSFHLHLYSHTPPSPLPSF